VRVAAADQARAARALVEAGLDGCGWKFSKTISLWIDLLILIEEGAA
jgi:hypothetical protein